MEEQLAKLVELCREALARASTPEEVEALRVRFLGKKGEIAQSLKDMGKLAPEERRKVGETVNQAKASVEELFVQAVARAEDAQLAAELQGLPLDVTLPGRARVPGRRHPVSRTLDEIVRTFARLGFDVATGPEIESDFYNFESLNFPKDHPARDMQDTFFVDPAWLTTKPQTPILLRTHTSPVQIRTMLTQKPPVRVVCPGKVYRSDSDITHTPMFHQVEGLLVDSQVTFAELKGTLDAFVKAFFGADTKTRFRPSFFPFTEPSAEVDITCSSCGGSGCRICKQTGWLEILGAGMVHPNVFKSVDYDPTKVTGFAFGMGVERIAMLRYRIDDLRLLFENDVRFLEQF